MNHLEHVLRAAGGALSLSSPPLSPALPPLSPCLDDPPDDAVDPDPQRPQRVVPERQALDRQAVQVALRPEAADRKERGETVRGRVSDRAGVQLALRPEAKGLRRGPGPWPSRETREREGERGGREGRRDGAGGRPRLPRKVEMMSEHRAAVKRMGLGSVVLPQQSRVRFHRNPPPRFIRVNGDSRASSESIAVRGIGLGSVVRRRRRSGRAHDPGTQ